jgi:hypothetical protein
MIVGMWIFAEVRKQIGVIPGIRRPCPNSCAPFRLLEQKVKNRGSHVYKPS